MSETPAIQGTDIHCSYTIGSKRVEVLRGIDVSVAKGERIFLSGASGAGKTTLLYCLAGLEEPSQGKVIVEGTNLYQLPRAKQGRFRNARMGFIFQNYFLLPEFTALENVLIPGMIGGVNGRERAEELLVAVGLEKRFHHLPAELSGGEQQRVAIARALVREPSIIFADEPTGNLDSRNGDEIMELLLGFAAKDNTTLIIVSHQPELARLGDRTLLIRDGEVLPGDG